MQVFPAEERHRTSRNGQAISGASIYSEDLLEREISEATYLPALSTGQDASATQKSIGLDSATPPAEERHRTSRNGQAISGASVYSEDLLEREINEATYLPALSTGQDANATQKSIGLDSATPPQNG
jgi:hypothetical protein